MVPNDRNGQVLIELCLMVGLLLAIFLCIIAVNHNHSVQAKKYEFKNRSVYENTKYLSETERRRLFKQFEK